MNDLPVFLQMFVRFFAMLTAGFWLHNLARTRAPRAVEADPPTANAPAQPGDATAQHPPAVTPPASPGVPAGK